MSTFEDDNYRWKETYFVLFDSARRPTLAKVQDALEHLAGRFELINPNADGDGKFESITLHAPQDYAALDVSYLAGSEVLEQGALLAKEMKNAATDASEKAKLARLPSCDARFDIMHFAQVTDDPDDMDEMLDPSALLLVMESLCKLTGGVGIDAQSDTIM